MTSEGGTLISEGLQHFLGVIMHSEHVKIWVLEILCRRLQIISKRCPTPPSAAEGAVFQSDRGFGPRSPLLDPPLNIALRRSEIDLGRPNKAPC